MFKHFFLWPTYLECHCCRRLCWIECAVEEPHRAFYIRRSGPAASCKLSKTTRQRAGWVTQRGHAQAEVACDTKQVSARPARFGRLQMYREFVILIYR